MTPKKNANGQGSGYRRADGTYVRALSYLDEATGKTKRLYLYGKTAKIASSKFKEAQARLERGAPIKDASRTVGEWAAQWGNTSLAASPRKESTKSLYDSLLRTHVINQPVGAIALNRLKPTDIEAMVVGLRSGMASSTVYKVFMVLRLSLDDAVRDGLLAVNPLQKVRPPAIESEEVRHLSADEVALLFFALKGSQYEAIVRLLAFSGLRKGEAIGLRWADVDFDRKTFKVVLTLSGFGPTEPKTKKSRRTVEMSEYVTTLLKTQRVKQLRDRGRAADVWTETGYVFTSETGTPLDPRNTLRAVTRAGKKAGLGHLNVHTLRHSVATMLLEAGVHDKAVADILGHSDTRMTARYTHTSDRYAREAMSGLAAALNSVAAPVAANPD